jgi:branched-chain amino acid transport system substrate-binding protein
MKTKQICLVLSVLVVTGVSELAFAADQQKQLTFGLSAALSGAAAPWGQGYLRSCTLATKEINAKGGITIKGEKYLVNFKSYDHAYDPSRAVENARRMIMVDKVAWINTHGATAVKPIIPFTEENKKICLHGTTGTDIAVFMKQKYAFKSMVLTPEVFFLGWGWVTKKYPEWKTTVEIQPDDASGWDAMQDVKEKVLPRYGIKLAADTLYKRGTSDFYPILSRLLAAKPDVFDLGNLPPADQGRIMKQAREMGYTGPFFAPSASTLGPTLEIAGPAAEGLILGSYINPLSKFATKEEKAFYDTFIEAYGPPFNFFSIADVISVHIVAQAIEKANSLDPDKIAETLQTAKFKIMGREVWVGGASVYGSRRNVISPYMISVIKNGKPEPIDIMYLPDNY